MNHLSILIDHGLDIVAKNAYVSFDSQENRSKIIGSVQEASKAVEAKLKVASSLVTGKKKIKSYFFLIKLIFFYL